MRLKSLAVLVAALVMACGESDPSVIPDAQSPDGANPDASNPDAAIDAPPTGPAIAVSDSVPPANDYSVAFGAVRTGMTATHTITVTNAGTAALVLGTVADANSLAAPFSITANTCSGTTLAATQSCTITVQFAPTTTNGASDSFDIPSNDPDRPTVAISVSGSGISPAIAVTDTVAPANDLSVLYGGVKTGTTATSTITVSNSGTADLVLGTIASGDPLASPFTITANTCSGATLTAGNSCTLMVQFAPTATGPASDSFDIPSNATTETFYVSGTGTLQQVAVTDSVAPSTDHAVPFGNVTVNTTTTRTVSVTNSGTADLVLGTVASANPLAAPFSITANNCSGMTLAPNTSCTITVQFAPTSLTASNDAFDIPSNDPSTPTVTVALSGTGAPPPSPSIAVTDTVAPADDLQVPFGDVVQNTVARQIVTITNIGTANLVLGMIGASDPIAPPFSFFDNPCSTRTLAPNASCTLIIEYAPIGTNAWAETFNVPSNDPDSPNLTVAVSGNGVMTIVPSAPVAKTGQTTCFDQDGNAVACAGTGQDGELQRGVAWPAQRFVAGTGTETNCITDALTGLQWTKQANLPGNTVTFAQALEYVKALNANGGMCGHTDWRLPNKNELRTLGNYGVTANIAWLGQQGFANVQTAYWSSTSHLTSDRAWLVNMMDGYLFISSKPAPNYVWPVRAGSAAAPAPVPKTGQTLCYDPSGSSLDLVACAGTGQDGELQRGVAWPASRFARQADSSITDTLTGLTWGPRLDTPAVAGATTCTGGARSWTSALAYVMCLNANTYLGHADWRLPNLNELQSLSGVVLNAEGFNGAPGLYWTSDSRVATPTVAFVVNLAMGAPGALKSSSYFALPVRGGS